eukprot:TRINITY_DN1671_c1_g1_i2.p1 TRINITY_DN1671_c1_g1~~TRINITY_DN1671_c1_g1_i2.p1  ORF type:complete len:339 (+),score=44.88 TRINITY_DN1671_c1_g1_i2:73-1089(+)
MDCSDTELVLKACPPGTRRRCMAAVSIIKRKGLGYDIEQLVAEWIISPILGPHNNWMEDEMLESCVRGSITGVLHLLSCIHNMTVYDRILSRCAMGSADAGSLTSLQVLAPKLSTNQLTATLVASCSSGHLSIVNYLLSQGADPSSKSSSGITPLWASSREGHLPIVRKLIQSGSQLDDKVNGTTPLWCASSNGHCNVVSELLNSGARVNECRETDNASALWVASRAGHTDVVTILLSHRASQVDTVLGQSPLWVASLCGHTSVVQILLAAGASAESSAITAAETAGHVELVSAIKTTQKRYQYIDSCGGYIVGLLITYVISGLVITALLRWMGMVPF